MQKALSVNHFLKCSNLYVEQKMHSVLTLRMTYTYFAVGTLWKVMAKYSFP